MMIIALVDIVIVAVLLTADLVTKSIAANYLPTHGNEYVAIKDVLTFRYSENSGAAFGMFENSRVFLSVFVGVVLLGLIVFMVYHIVKKKYREKGDVFLHVALSMILAGGIGNLVDRIAFGYVRDFIDYTILYTLFKIDFAICNLADVFLTIGVILIIIYLIYCFILDWKKERQKKVIDGVPVDGSDHPEDVSPGALPEVTDAQAESVTDKETDERDE